MFCIEVLLYTTKPFRNFQTCALTDGTKIESVTSVISAILPDAKLRHAYGAEVTYELSPSRMAMFGELFKRLETFTGLESFGIKLPSLEDVFLK